MDQISSMVRVLKREGDNFHSVNKNKENKCVLCRRSHSMCSKTHTSNEKLIRTLCASYISIASRNLLSARALCCLIMQFNNLSRSQRPKAAGGWLARTHTMALGALSGGWNPSVGTADETRSADQGDRPLPAMTTFSSESNNIHHTCWSMREIGWKTHRRARRGDRIEQPLFLSISFASKRSCALWALQPNWNWDERDGWRLIDVSTTLILFW